jgi:hypothetical protein
MPPDEATPAKHEDASAFQNHVQKHLPKANIFSADMRHCLRLGVLSLGMNYPFV